MKQNTDSIAIYSRKSKFTGKGESIGNQIELCKEYIRAHYGDDALEHLVVYEDEGFSGGNLNRPDFKKMMAAAKERKFKAIIVYRLDRISRNISDFSSLIEELARLDVAFVSIKEQFDTGSPMGRAMMYIASVFSQLERETIRLTGAICRITVTSSRPYLCYAMYQGQYLMHPIPCRNRICACACYGLTM